MSQTKGQALQDPFLNLLRKQHADELKRLGEKHEDAVKNLNASFEKRVTQIETDNARQ